jgi:hypothetical protein
MPNEVEQFIEDNEMMRVKIVEGVSYNMRDVIDKAYILYNGMFQTDSTEENGFERIFMRKMWVVYRTLVQGSDLDLKNLNIRNQNGVKAKLAGLLKMLFISHLEREQFGEKIDEIMAQMCWFGSSIVKRHNGTVDIIDFRNYITEANQPDPQLRKHLLRNKYSYDRVMSYKKEWKNFDKVMDLWERMQKAGKTTFDIIEFWTFNKEGKKVCKKYLDTDIDGNETLTPEGRFVFLEEFDTPYKVKRTSKRLIKKLGKYEDRFPFEQFDFFDVQGRTFGMGCAELLGGPQEYYNELFSNKRKLDLKALRGIMIHNAIMGEDGLSEIDQEAITNIDTGFMMTLVPGEKIEQLPVNTYSFDFDLMEQKIYELMRQIIGVTAQGTGEEMPASTSATQASINQQVANTVFDYVRERMHHGLKRLFNKGYAQDIIDEMDEKKIVAITGDPTALAEFDKMLVENAMNSWAIKYRETMGILPTEEEFMEIENTLKQELLKQGDTRFPEFKKELIDDMEYILTFEFQQESFDYKLRSDALLAIKNDPNSTKSKAKIEDELLSLQGLNPRQYDKTEEEIAQEQQIIQQQ